MVCTEDAPASPLHPDWVGFSPDEVLILKGTSVCCCRRWYFLFSQCHPFLLDAVLVQLFIQKDPTMEVPTTDAAAARLAFGGVRGLGHSLLLPRDEWSTTTVVRLARSLLNPLKNHRHSWQPCLIMKAHPAAKSLLSKYASTIACLLLHPWGQKLTAL